MECELSVLRHGWGPPAREWASIDAFLSEIDALEPEPEPEPEPRAPQHRPAGSGTRCKNLDSFVPKMRFPKNVCKPYLAVVVCSTRALRVRDTGVPGRWRCICTSLIASVVGGGAPTMRSQPCSLR